MMSASSQLESNAQADSLCNFLPEPAAIIQMFNDFYSSTPLANLASDFLNGDTRIANDFLLRVKYMSRENKKYLSTWIATHKKELEKKTEEFYTPQELYLISGVACILDESLYPKAREMIGTAASKGLTLAQTDLAERSRARSVALSFYEAAALTGDRRAITGLGELAETQGQLTYAHKYYQIAAAKGCPWAFIKLGALYHSGQGVKKDPNLARACYAKATSLGQPQGFYLLGLIYERELKDVNKARECYEQIADARYACGDMLETYLLVHINLARLYTEARGIPQDIARASQLLFQALRHSNKSNLHCLSIEIARLRNVIEKQITELKSVLKNNMLAQPLTTNLYHLFAVKAEQPLIKASDEPAVSLSK